MKAKDKAIELVDRMCQTIADECEHSSYCDEPSCVWEGTVYCRASQEEAKQCALIAVDEILNIDFIIPEHGSTNLTYNYWESVKQEIEKL